MNKNYKKSYSIIFNKQKTTLTHKSNHSSGRPWNQIPACHKGTTKGNVTCLWQADHPTFCWGSSGFRHRYIIIITEGTKYPSKTILTNHMNLNTHCRDLEMTMTSKRPEKITNRADICNSHKSMRKVWKIPSAAARTTSETNPLQSF